MLNNKMNLIESDKILQNWLNETDETMYLPSFESEPHLLISKVRKHYMEYLIKLLSENYEHHQMLPNKNIYLPSAIWRCAKLLEMSAAKSSMVVQLYRENIIPVIKNLKESTKKSKLFRQLYECLKNAPANDKNVQVALIDSRRCNCKCVCGLKRKREPLATDKYTVPQTCVPPNKKIEIDKANLYFKIPEVKQPTTAVNDNFILQPAPVVNKSTSNEVQKSDDIIKQLDELFQGIPDDDDIFDSILESVDNIKYNNEESNVNKDTLETQKSLDQRLNILNGIIDTSIQSSTKECKKKQTHVSKWLCEEYFLKVKLYEKMDDIRENKRNKLFQIKTKMLDLFGDDSDDEGVVSPIDETLDFMASCKRRTAPWVVELLNPYYAKGRIRGKALFKSLAKHLIQLIYLCSKYPFEYEVASFVKDFLESHKIIRCEADFLQFTIQNV